MHTVLPPGVHLGFSQAPSAPSPVTCWEILPVAHQIVLLRMQARATCGKLRVDYVGVESRYQMKRFLIYWKQLHSPILRVTVTLEPSLAGLTADGPSMTRLHNAERAILGNEKAWWHCLINRCHLARRSNQITFRAFQHFVFPVWFWSQFSTFSVFIIIIIHLFREGCRRLESVNTA